jgi:hypothetical protein
LNPLVKSVLSGVSELSINAWFEIGQRLLEAGTNATLSADEIREFEFEAQAFRLVPVPKERVVPFAYTFPELLWVGEGIDIKAPSLAMETIEYWRSRVTEESHSLLRARYADLVWELEHFTSPGKQRDHNRARIAIESYLEGVRSGLVSNPAMANGLLDRALDIAAKLNDTDRINEVVDEFLSRAENAPVQGHAGVWLHPAKTLLNSKLLTSERRERLKIELERRFTEAVAQEDQLAADIAISHLLSVYAKPIHLPERQRALLRYGAMHRNIAKNSTPLLAVSRLLSVVDLYEDHGLPVEADELRLYVEEVSPRVKEAMKTISVEQSIDIAEVDSFFEPLLETDKTFVALFRIARNTAPKVDKVRRQLEELRRVAPFQFLVSRITFGDSGLPTTQTGSADDNPDEHLSMQYGQSMSLSSVFFLFGWQRIVTKFDLDAVKVLAAIEGTPLIHKDRKTFFLEGINAHFEKDYLKAIHVLVPQVENMLRELLRVMHIPRSKRVRNKPGITELKTMGDILRDARLADSLEDDLLFFLNHLYIEKYGLNLRNDLSHGIASLEVFNEMTSGMVIQSIILLSVISPECIYMEQTAPTIE